MVQNPPPEQSKDKSFAKAITNINHVFVGNTIISYMQKSILVIVTVEVIQWWTKGLLETKN